MAHLLEECGWLDVQEYLQHDDRLILVIGSTEQHGRHLVLGTDVWQAWEIAARLSERSGVLLAPPVSYGMSLHHLGFPGTLSLRPQTLSSVVADLLESAYEHGFRRILLLNGHGGNDAQKTMGIIAMAMITTGYASEFYVPWWVITVSAGAIALGTLTGGWRLIKTLGGKFYKIRPVHAFGSQLTSSSVILGAALLGGPVSTTQVVSSAIMGAGSADRVSKVRWTVARDIAVAWLLTIPVAALLAAGLYLLIDLFV